MDRSASSMLQNTHKARSPSASRSIVSRAPGTARRTMVGHITGPRSSSATSVMFSSCSRQSSKRLECPGGPRSVVMGSKCPRPRLSLVRAPGAKVERLLEGLLTRLRVDDLYLHTHPAIVAGVGVLVLAVIMVFSGGRGMRYSHGRQPPCRLAGSRGASTPAGPFALDASYCA